MMKSELTNKYLSLFTTEMAAAFQAGINPGKAIRVLLGSADKDEKIVFESLLCELDDGAPLSKALEKSGYFSEHMIRVTEAGEKTGRIVDAMKSLAKYYEMLDRFTVSVKSALFFPVILLATMLVVVILMITQVLPIFNDVFGRLGNRMSPLAVSFMRFGEWLNSISIIITLVFGAIFVLVLLLKIFPVARTWLRKSLWQKWGGRGLLGEIASYHFLSVMTLSITSGMDIERVIELASNVSGGTKAVDERNAECAKRLRQGATIAEAMGDAGILTLRETQLLSFGVQGGITDQTMAEIVRRKEQGLLDAINSAISRIEPVLIVTISALVGVILLSVMLPLMGIMNSLGV